MIDLEEKINVDKIIVADKAAAGEAGSPNKDKNSFSYNSQQNDDDDEVPQKGKVAIRLTSSPQIKIMTRN